MIDISTISQHIDVDFAFIKTLEEPSILHAYVPDAGNSQCGVTIASGCDLAQLSLQDLRKFSLNPTLIGKLYPYLGLKGGEALSYLQNFPLQISENESLAIDTGYKTQMLEQLCKRFDEASASTFSSIPPPWQTVIASIESQYGNLQKSCPNFWTLVTSQSWQDALYELRNFGDNYAKRRNLEADYVEQHLSA